VTSCDIGVRPSRLWRGWIRFVASTRATCDEPNGPGNCGIRREASDSVTVCVAPGLLLGRGCDFRRACRGDTGADNEPRAPGHRRHHVARRGRAAFNRLGRGRVRGAHAGRSGIHCRRNRCRCRYVQHRERSSRDRHGPQALRAMQAATSEADAPGSGTSIALGTALDAVPEALILGVTLRGGGPDLALVAALALSNLPEALSGTAGMRRAHRFTC
jgi:hypothetical protein